MIIHGDTVFQLSASVTMHSIVPFHSNKTPSLSEGDNAIYHMCVRLELALGKSIHSRHVLAHILLS
mgnify:CR=1 FL=1